MSGLQSLTFGKFFTLDGCLTPLAVPPSPTSLAAQSKEEN